LTAASKNICMFEGEIDLKLRFPKKGKECLIAAHRQKAFV